MYDTLYDLIGTGVTSISTVWGSINNLNATKAQLEAQIQYGSNQLALLQEQKAIDKQKNELAIKLMELQNVNLQLKNSDLQTKSPVNQDNTNLYIAFFVVLFIIFLIVILRKNR